MIITTEMLRAELNKYANPDAKIKRLVDGGELIPVVRGLYETNPSVPGHCLAQSIYGPSYLSFEFALSYHSLIPERVYHFTCATFEKKKIKKYNTGFGMFVYRDVPSEAFPVGVELKIENGYSFMIATAEKAICDMLYKTSPLRNCRGLETWLFEDLRLSFDDFFRLNSRKLNEISQLYRTQNHKLLRNLIRKEVKNGAYFTANDRSIRK